MILWRIATEIRRYPAHDLSGMGAALYPGRWNDEGQPVVYAAPSVSLAVLEAAAHLPDAGLPMNRFLLQIEVADTDWDARTQLRNDNLPAGWSAIPAGQASVAMGAAWLEAASTLLLSAPSVIVPEEHIALINPRHPNARRLTAQVVRRFDYNALFRPA